MEAGAPLLLYQESIAPRASVLHAPLHERGRDTERLMERGAGQGESRQGFALEYSQGGEGRALSLSWPVRAQNRHLDPRGGWPGRGAGLLAARVVVVVVVLAFVKRAGWGARCAVRVRYRALTQAHGIVQTLRWLFKQHVALGAGARQETHVTQ